MSNDITVRDWTCWRDPTHEPISTTIYGWPQCSVCRAAPEFHERAKYLPDNFALGLYVPVDRRARVFIAERSAIVGLPNGGEGEDDYTEVYYEGWVNGPMQYGDRDPRGLWEAGVEHAGSRMVCRYPTVAMAYLPSVSLKCIGLYFPKFKTIEVNNEDLLEGWLR